MAKNTGKWIVRVPVTVLVCVEVEAHNKSTAIIAANEKVNNLVPLFNGTESQLDRPPWLGLDGGEEDQTAWFDTDSLEDCDLFLTNKVQVEPLKA